MAIVQTGTVLQFGQTGANTGTVSTTITVPADAEIAIVGWSGFSTTVGFFSGGSMTFTKGGVDSAMTFAGVSSEGANWQGAMFYIVSPDTGSNKTLKWDWSGAGSASDGSSKCSITFWKGIDTASTVRGVGTGTNNPNTPYTSSSITALTGDLIVAWVGGFAFPDGSIDTWSNLTGEGTNIVNTGSADGAWATGSPTGDTTVAALTDTNFADGGIVAISLKPAASTFQWYPMGFPGFTELPIIRPILDIIGY